MRKTEVSRGKKEELKRYNEARDNLSGEEIVLLNMQEFEQNEQLEEAHDIHDFLFSEEHDFHYDSIADAKLRDKGINPMSEEYIYRTNNKRKEMGFNPLSTDGHAPNNDTFNFIHNAIINDGQYLIDNLIKIYEKY